MPPLGISNVAALPPSASLAWSRLRGPLASVGTGVCKYGPTNGYATPNGVTGFIGPPAGSLQKPTAWYVRVGGSNVNGGTTTSLSSARTGTDGSGNSGNATFTSASGNFTSADVGQGLCVQGWSGANRYYKIIAVSNSTTVTLDRNGQSVASSLTWTLGGAWADIQTIFALPASQLAATVILSGDSIYIGAGTYRATTNVGGFTPAYNGLVSIVGDVYGLYTGDAGMVQLTAYTTNDKAAAALSSLMNLNGKSNLAFFNIFFVGGNANPGCISLTAGAQNVSFTDCAFVQYLAGTGALCSVVTAFGVTSRVSFDRCDFVCMRNNNVISVSLTSANSGADYDAQISFTNCRAILGDASGRFIGTNAAANTFKGGGIRARNCTVIGGVGMLLAATSTSTIFTCLFDNGFIVAAGGATAALVAGATNQMTEDYNLIHAAVARSNVTAGAHSISDGSYAPLFHFGQERIWGGLVRPFGEPMSGSPLLGFGNDGVQTAYDLYNRPRPAGGGALPYSAAGALERGNTPSQATSPAPPTGTYDWQFTGPGFQEFLLPVNASSTTITIKVQRDSAYSPPPGATLPALQILANARLGISAQTIVDTGASGGWNTLSAVAFTPSGTGWVTVRIASYDGTGVSVVSFANLSVT